MRQGSHPVLQLARRPAASTGHRRIYISAGIHGDEPGSVMAVLELLRVNEWPGDAEVLLFPCLNPEGLELNRREGPEGVDFNRDYRNPKTAVVRAHREWLQPQPAFDLALLLHEDWEADGFYLYELNTSDRASTAEEITCAVAQVCPVLRARKADGWPASKGVVRPQVDPATRPDWPEALYLSEEKTDLCYTFEAPSDFALATRVAALVTAVNVAIRQITSESP
jgi:predicted deacylase